MQSCQCVFPAPAEQELITIPGAEAGTAFRIFADTSRDGYVRVQQLAHDAGGLGWYVQKSMVIPREVLAIMLPELRKAQCLMPPAQAAQRPPLSVSFMRLTDAPEHTPTAERRVS